MSSDFEDLGTGDSVSMKSKPGERCAVYLPSEVLFTIMSFVQLQETPQKTLHSSCLVSWSWYCVAVVLLYQAPVVIRDKFPLFYRTMCSSDNFHNLKGSVSKYVKTLDLGACFNNVHEVVPEKLLVGVEGGLELFVAPSTFFTVKSLAALSKCRKLAHLDLSQIYGSFRVDDLARLVSRLSYLKIFHFPQKSTDCGSSSLGEHVNRINQMKPKWPNSLEKLYIPRTMDVECMLALQNTPTSLTSLVIKEDRRAATGVLYMVFDLLGPQISALEVDYYQNAGRHLAIILIKFPNLLRLSVPSRFISAQVTRYIDLGTDHPLQSITLNMGHPNDLHNGHFSSSLEDLLNKNRWPNIRSITLKLTHESPIDRWENFFRTMPAPGIHSIKRDLRKWSDPSSGSNENGFTEIWLEDKNCSKDNPPLQFTKESLVRIRRG